MKRSSLLVATFAIACGSNANEISWLLDTEDAPASACPNGGTIAHVGPDANDDGVLDVTERAGQFVSCRGADGRAALLDLRPQPPGGACPNGGIAIGTGNDIDGDTLLDEAERSATAVVCRGDAAPAWLISLQDATTECPSSGVVIVSGPDADGDGTLDANEATQRFPVCAGDPAAPLLVDAHEASTAECAVGGTRFDIGDDLNGNSTLDPKEVSRSELVCRTAPALVDVALEAAGASTACPDGGIRLRTGLDADGDGRLGPNEVDATNYVCGGPSGSAPLVILRDEAPGAACATGGQRVEVGIDTNGDDVLDPSEVQPTDFVCNGQPAGAGGLVRTTPLAPGTACPNGGVQVESGPDVDVDGQLDPNEVAQTRLLCNGARTGTALVDVETIAAGAECVQGGARLSAGVDTDGDGVLDPGEVAQTTVICDATSDPPFFVRTPALPDAFVGQSYSARLEAVGGSGGGYRWRVVSGTPPGLRFVQRGEAGVFVGTPSTAGTSNVEVEVVDFFGEVVRRTYPLDVGVQLRVVATTLPALTPGVAYQAQLVATEPATWQLVSGALPAGVTLSPAGQLSGVPQARFGRRFVVEATTSDGRSARRKFLLPGQTRYVAFSQRDTSTSPADVYVMDISGGTPGAAVRVSPVSQGGRGARYLSESLDPCCRPLTTLFSSGGRVAFVGDYGTRNAAELYVVDLSGATVPQAALAHPAFGNDREVRDVQWALDAEILVYTSDQRANGVFEVYAVDFTGGSPSPPVRLNPTISGTFGGVANISVSPDGAWVAFSANLTVANRFDLYLAPTAGGAATLVRPEAGSQMRWSPDSRWLHTDEHPGSPRLFDVTATPVAEHDYAPQFLRSVAFAPTSDRMAFAFGSGHYQLGVVELTEAGPLPPVDATDFAGPDIALSMGRLLTTFDRGTPWSAAGDHVLAEARVTGYVQSELHVRAPLVFATAAGAHALVELPVAPSNVPPEFVGPDLLLFADHLFDVGDLAQPFRAPPDALPFADWDVTAMLGRGPRIIYRRTPPGAFEPLNDPGPPLVTRLGYIADLFPEGTGALTADGSFSSLTEYPAFRLHDLAQSQSVEVTPVDGVATTRFLGISIELPRRYAR